jgi:hypothetical protein
VITFGNSASGRVALNSNVCYDKVADRVGHDMAGIIDSHVVSGMPVLGKQVKDTFYKLRSGRRLVEEVLLDVLSLMMRGMGWADA